MALYLGIDTSNYTTSAALYDSITGTVTQQRRLLSVKPGDKGLRQSDALFQHVRELPEIFEKLYNGEKKEIAAVGFSARPRDVEGSYMPCFLAGREAALCISAACSIKSLEFSHQAGHIAAALYSTQKLSMIKEKFIAFHVSGGTTDVVVVSPKENYDFIIEPFATSLDLKAGQAIDRVGVMLGLDFPAGPKLEELALQSNAKFKIHPCMKGNDCCLSGLENKCDDMIRKGEKSCDVARFCLEFIKITLDAMTAAAIKEIGNLPILFAGGVMSNSIIREYMTGKYGALFAKPEFSSDNASGIAALTKIKTEGL